MSEQTSSAGPASLNTRMLQGSKWAIGGHVAHQGLRLCGNLILWRLLFPEVFGLMAIIGAFMQGLEMFSDVGIAPAIIQSKKGDVPEYLNTAWTLQAMRGIAIFLIAVVAAVPLAQFYEEPELASLMPIVGLGAAIMGFASTKPITATRHVTLGRRTIMDMAAQVTGLASTVTWAAIHPSVWAMVVGGLIANLTHVVMSHTFLSGTPNRLHWNRDHAKAMLRFGKWIFLSTVLTFLVGQADRLVFGKLISMEELGVFSIASIWATLPVLVINAVLGMVVFPLLSKVHNDGGEFAHAFQSVRAPWLLLGGWLVTCLVAGGPALIRFLYDTRAENAGWIVQVLAVGVWFQSLQAPNHNALLAKGLARLATIPNATKLVSMLSFIAIGMWSAGFAGAVAGLAASELLRYIVSVIVLSTQRVKPLPHDLGLTAAVASIGGVGFLIAHGMHNLLAAFTQERLAAFLEGFVVFLFSTSAWFAIYKLTQHRAR